MPFIVPFPGVTPVITLALLDHDFTGFVTGGSHSFSVDCGGGGDIVFGAQINTSGSFGTVTLDGITCTQRVVVSGFCAIYTVSGVGAGTKTLTINISGGSGLSTRWAVQVYSISGHSTLVPDSTATGNSTTLNIPANSGAIGAHIEVGGTSTALSYSGLTTRVSDDSGVTTVYGSGMDNFTNANSSLSVSVTGNGTGTPIGTWAVWKP